MYSFLLIGQSNMAGRGFLEEALPVDMERLYVLRNARWTNMYRPVSGDWHTAGVSLGESFAESYAKKHDVDVGLIPCAVGGTTMAQWMPGELLYDHAVMQTKLAMRTSTLAGILWHQGECDCTDDLLAIYKEKLQTMLNQLRKDLGLPNIPILLGGIGDYLVKNDSWEHYGWQNTDTLNRLLQSVAAESETIGYVPADGLEANPDLVHFSAAALHEFGLRYFAAYETLCEGKKLVGETAVQSDTKRTGLELL